MFRKAERKRAKLRLGIAGLSGSGKTWSALEIASGLSPENKIAMLDTEAGRGELYAENFNYDVLQISAPFSPEKYINAIQNAQNAGYEVLIIDSLSHAWAGEGGILSIVDKIGGKSFTDGWKKASPMHNALVEAIILSKLHIIFTMRSKSEYVVEANDRGKMAPRKVGLAPVQRDGLEYECTLYMEMSLDHIAHVTKDNTQLYDQQFLTPNKEMGKALLDWLMSGKTQEQILAEALMRISSEIDAAEDMEKLIVTVRNLHRSYPDLADVITPNATAKKLQLQETENATI